MERWHSTFEDIMSMRSSSSSNNVFKDNYWAQNGFDELRRFVKQGGDFTKELSSILQERVDAELTYAKCLSKLGSKLNKACKESVGSCMEAWKQVGVEMEKRGEIHRNYSLSLLEDIVKPLKNVMETQTKLRKKVDGGVDKTTKALYELRLAEAKSKKQSHTATRDNEKLQDSLLETRSISRSSSIGHIPHAHTILNAVRPDRLHITTNGSSDKDAAKLQVKKKKTEDTVKRTEIEYYNLSVQAERARLEWETAVVKGAGMLESLEEERLLAIKNTANRYLNITVSMHPLLTKCIESLNTPILNANHDQDMKVIRGVRSAPAGPSEQLLPDFYCEHTTLAMNRERRKQALVKILHLIKQDIDRERKSMQGLEKLSAAMKQTPTFGSDDTQQNVAEKLYHMRSMLTYLEAARYKVNSALNEMDGRQPSQHPLASHIQIVRDKQGLQQSVLKVPPWLQNDYQNEVSKNLQPNYAALKGYKTDERRDSIKSKTRMRIEQITFKKFDNSLPTTPVTSVNDTDSVIKLDLSEREAGDGISSQRDSDFDEFSSQESGSNGDLTKLDNTSYHSALCVSEPQNDECIGKCRALYNYTPKLSDELTLVPGDVILIHKKQDDGWWIGDLNGNIGIFPATYVQEINTY